MLHHRGYCWNRRVMLYHRHRGHCWWVRRRRRPVLKKRVNNANTRISGIETLLMAESDPRPAMCHPSPLLLLLCCWCLAGRTQQSHGSSLQDNMRELHDRFAVSLYQTLTETENNNSNLIVSPGSVVGNASQGVWLQQATALFIQSGVQLLTEFKSHAEAWVNSSLVRSRFSQPNRTHGHTLGSPTAARGGHQRSTSGEVQGEAPGWGQRLQMALVNMVAFRGIWQKQFLFTNTQNLPFTLSDGSTVKVPMMYQATEVYF
ncbi:hypothetical protein CRUP_000162, partial [Coryphaenoides rupestris]